MSEIKIKRGSDLPGMPSFEGATEKVIVFGIRYDTGETVNFPLSEFIRALTEGEIIPKMADNLNIGSSIDVNYTQSRAIESTGGDHRVGGIQPDCTQRHQRSECNIQGREVSMG